METQFDDPQIDFLKNPLRLKIVQNFKRNTPYWEQATYIQPVHSKEKAFRDFPFAMKAIWQNIEKYLSKSN